MSQQGGRPTGHEDDWWGQLYDTTDDTGPAPAPDTLDDRFASAAGTVRDGSQSGAAEDGGARAGAGVPAPRSGAPEAPETAPPGSPGRHRGSGELPPDPADPPEGPAAYPPGPKPPGFVARSPETPPPSGSRTSTETPPATSVPASRMPPDAPRPPAVPPPPAQGADRPDAGLGTGPDADATPADTGRAPSARRAADDWWAAAPPEPDIAAAALPEPDMAPAPAPRTGPGFTQPNPTAEPPARVQESAAPEADATPAPPALRTATHVDLPTLPPPPVGFVGSGPPTYDAEPTALPPADPDELDDLVADTVLDGARYGACTLRAVSVRGDSARFRGEPRRDSLLTARFGTGEQALVLVAMATGARATPGAHRAAAEACHWIARAVGRSHARLAQDITAARRGDLKSGLHRLTDRSLGKLRASAAEQGIDPEEYAATLRCLLLPADPDCRVRVFFGVGAGGLFRLRDGEWHDIEPRITEVTGEPVVGFGSLPTETPEGDRLTMDLGIPTPPSPYEPAPEPSREPFRFRASVARPGDTLLMCTGGLAEPLRGEPGLCEYLTGRWSGPTAPGLAAFLADSQVRVKGYADDRTAAAVWEA
ncbi:protein phosphatase 2C domain-containing protein [Streptomyces sp. SID13726]|uniref:protein phosphatase 2C domain-containing protein n=1 Tax=Streptomyces sp. SID13726 TaxID=2706058 RepID=UPI0019419AFF|nr:protein phosphatase 2C domain-containing protein [Streptomyces sp. SID13726]